MKLTITNRHIIDGMLSPDVSLAGAKEVMFNDCYYLKVSPEILVGVEKLTFVSCPHLEIITNFPVGSKKIRFNDCKHLRIIPHIPDGVEELTFVFCEFLETITNFPAGVKKIEFEDCEDE